MNARIPLGLFHLVSGRPPRKSGATTPPATPPAIPGAFWTPQPAKVPEKLVLLVHGLDEPGRIWDDAAHEIAAEGHHVARFDYPNDQPIAASATMLTGAIRKLAEAGVRELRLVGHSMGGLVCRDVLTRGVPPVSIPTLITVGTPHAGSSLAGLRWIAEAREQVVRWVDAPGWTFAGSASPPELRGQAGVDLTPGSAFLLDLNARPHPAGVAITVVFGRWLAGSQAAKPNIGTAILDAIGDGVVSIASARLAGIDDHVEVLGNHRGILRRLTPGAVIRAKRGLTPLGVSPPAVPVILDRLRAR